LKIPTQFIDPIQKRRNKREKFAKLANEEKQRGY
jgi:hypothetical protein